MTVKHATSMGSALPDPIKSQAAASPMPIPVMENKTAPGQTGPRGLSPRTTYSRVNASSPPVSSIPDAPKMTPPRGAEFLPAKTAHAEERHMTMTQRPTLHDLLTAAMEGTISQVNITKEAARQLTNHRGEEHAEADEVRADHYPTEHILKMAAALEYISASSGQTQKPGQGPGALQVLQATSEGQVLEAGQSGSAVGKDQPPKNPSLQPEQVQVGKANTGLETNDDMSHGEQPLHPVKNQSASIAPANPLPNPTTQTKEGSAAKDLATANLERLERIKQAGKAPIKQLRKLAEDAINPAKIEAGKENPPDASASGQGVPSQPSDVSSQARLIGSNESAINYTKGQAKADPKSDVNQLLTQPALTRAGDSVLHQAFDHTEQAGVKISSAKGSLAGDTIKVAAARALLSDLMDKVAAEKGGKKKEKDSMSGGAPTSPSAASGFSASSLG